REVCCPRRRHAVLVTVPRGPHQDRAAIPAAADGSLQSIQPREHPWTSADDVRRRDDREPDVRTGRRGGNGHERAAVPREYRPAADVPVSGEVHILSRTTST